MSLSFLIRRASSLRYILRSKNAFATSPTLMKIVLTNNLSPASRSTAHSSPEVREQTDKSLLKAVDSEIKRFIPDLDIPSGFPFLIHDKRAEGTILLTRQDQDETVKVEVDVATLERLFGSGIQGDGDIQIYSAVSKGNAPSFPMLVSVCKAGNGSSMEFRVSVSEEDVSIDSLTIKNPDSQGCANHDYGGPNFLPTLMLIGLVTLLIVDLPLVIVSFLVLLSSPGVARNRLLWHDPALRPNTEHWLILLLSYCGFDGYYRTWVYTIQELLLYIVTIVVLFK